MSDDSPPPPDDGRCIEMNRRGTRCANRAPPWGAYCRWHDPEKARCAGRTFKGKLCLLPAGEDGFCEHHRGDSMDERENGAGWTPDGDEWPEGVSVAEEEVVKKVVTVAIDLGHGQILQAVVSKGRFGRIESVNVGVGSRGHRPPADSQTGPVKGSEFKKLIDALGRIFEEAEPQALEL